MLSLKYDISEIPIELPYRKQGNSKMEIKHIFISFIKLLLFSLKEKNKNIKDKKIYFLLAMKSFKSFKSTFILIFLKK